MISRLCLTIALLAAQPASAGCFLGIFCSPPHHHHLVHRHHHRSRVVHKIIVHETVVKKVIVRERKAHSPTVDITPITPLR